MHDQPWTEATVDGTLGIVGCGRMGEAILAGLLAAGTCEPGHVVVADPRGDQLERVHDEYGVDTSSENTDALAAEVVLLAVKPQVLPGVLETDGAAVAEDSLVVSIAAGTSTATLDHLLPNRPAIVRVMPNTPALVGAGAAVVAAGPRATDEDVALVEELFAPLGLVRTLPESSLDAVTALSGSGPAYVFLLAEAMAEAGVRVGLSRDDAVALANQTVAGAGVLLTSGLGSATELREAVTSPGGTTAAALHALERAGVRAAVLDAVQAAAARAEELG